MYMYTHRTGFEPIYFAEIEQNNCMSCAVLFDHWGRPISLRMLGGGGGGRENDFNSRRETKLMPYMQNHTMDICSIV